MAEKTTYRYKCPMGCPAGFVSEEKPKMTPRCENHRCDMVLQAEEDAIRIARLEKQVEQLEAKVAELVKLGAATTAALEKLEGRVRHHSAQ